MSEQQTAVLQQQAAALYRLSLSKADQREKTCAVVAAFVNQWKATMATETTDTTPSSCTSSSPTITVPPLHSLPPQQGSTSSLPLILESVGVASIDDAAPSTPSFPHMLAAAVPNGMYPDEIFQPTPTPTRRVLDDCTLATMNKALIEETIIAAVTGDPRNVVQYYKNGSPRTFTTLMRVGGNARHALMALLDTGNGSESCITEAQLAKCRIPGRADPTPIEPLSMTTVSGETVVARSTITLPVQFRYQDRNEYTPQDSMVFHIIPSSFPYVVIGSKHIVGGVGEIVKHAIDWNTALRARQRSHFVTLSNSEGDSWTSDNVHTDLDLKSKTAVMASFEVEVDRTRPFTVASFLAGIAPRIAGPLEHQISEALASDPSIRALHADGPDVCYHDQLRFSAQALRRSSAASASAAADAQAGVPDSARQTHIENTPVPPLALTHKDKRAKVDHVLRFLTKASPDVREQEVQYMLDNYDKLFVVMGRIKGHEADIELVEGGAAQLDALPGPHPRKIKPHMIQAVQEDIQSQLDNGIIRKLVNPTREDLLYVSPAHVVPKASKGDGKMRVRITVDMREVNKVTKPHPAKFRIPTAQFKFQEIQGKKILICADLRAAFHLVELNEKSRKLTTFSLGGEYYQYLRMPMGAVNSAIDFQNIVQSIFPDWVPYLDDLVSGANSEDEGLRKLQKLLEQGLAVGATFDIDKLQIGPQAKVLGFMTDGQRRWFSQDDKGAKAVTSPDFTIRSLDDLRAFLGLVNWYSPFLPKLNIALDPLRQWMSTATRVGKDGLPEACARSVREVQKLIAEAQPIWLPVPGQPFYVASDASDVGLSGVLLQMHAVDDPTLPEVTEALAAGRAETGENGKVYLPRPVAYWSQPLSMYSKNLNVTEREALAALQSVLTWKEELQGSRVVVFTDHANLQYLFSSSNLIVRRAAMQMLAFLHPEFVHIAGKNNQLADFISRYPYLAASLTESVKVEAKPSKAGRRPTNRQLLQVAAMREGGVVDATALVAAATTSSVLSSATSYPVGSVHTSVDDTRLDLFDTTFKLPTPVINVEYKAMNAGKATLLNCDSLEGTPVAARFQIRPSAVHGPNIGDKRTAAVAGVTATKEAGSKRQYRTRQSVPPTVLTQEGDTVLDNDDQADHHVAESEAALRLEKITAVFDEDILVQLTHMSSSILDILEKYALSEDTAWLAKASDKKATVQTWHGYQLLLDEERRLPVPAEDRDLKCRILALCHEDAGHCGITQTKRNAQGFIWENMAEEITSYVETCPLCQVTRPPGKLQMHGEIILHDTPTPGERVLIDLVGPLPKVNGYTYIVNMMDAASRFKYVEPIAHATTEAVIPVLLRWCTLYGTPNIVQSDNGSCFKSAHFAAFCKVMGMTHHRSKPHHQQSNGKLERTNQQLKHALRVYGINKERSWPDTLFHYQARCNHMFNRSIGMAPITAFFGRETRLPLDAMTPYKHFAVPTPGLLSGGYDGFIANMKDIHSRAYQNSLLAQEAAKAAHDKGRVDPNFQEGESVIMIDPIAPTSSPAWKGPYKVLGRGADDFSYRLQHPVTGEETVLHAQRLRRFHSERLTESDLRDMTPIKANDYFVEAIREVVVQSNGTAMVLVKWRFQDQPTWERVVDVHDNGQFEAFIQARGYEIVKHEGELKLAKFSAVPEPKSATSSSAKGHTT